MKVSSQVTFIAAIQSLFGFACKIGYLPVNLGTLLRRPALPVNIAERIVNAPSFLRSAGPEPVPVGGFNSGECFSASAALRENSRVRGP